MLKIEPAKPLQAKLYLTRKKRGPHFRLFVFRDERELQEFGREQSKILGTGAKGWSKTLGCAQYFGPSTIKRKPKQIGNVILCRDHCDVGIVSHEMAHAALYAITRNTYIVPKRGPMVFKLTRPGDERLAWLVGWLCTQFYRWYWKQKGTRAR